MADLPTAHGYVRGSTEEQKNTLEAQERAIRQEYERHKANYRLGDIYIDSGESGAIPIAERENGNRMCRALQSGDLVIISKLDRGWRSVADFCATMQWWREKKIRLCLIDMNLDTASPAGMLILQVMAAVAEFERELLRERMRTVYALRRAKGLPCGSRAPYGYQIVGHEQDRQYAPFPEQRIIGQTICRMRDNAYTWMEILTEFNRRGIVNPNTDRPFDRGTVANWAEWERNLLIQEHLRMKERNGQ